MEIVYVVTVVILIVMLAIVIIDPSNLPTFSIYSTGPPSFIKRQWVRILDILVLGPVALAIGYKLEKDGYKTIPYLLYAYAFGTMVYNFSNLIAYQK